ncbi:hypothetical protein D3C83_81810 [compost metagenome]
MQPLGPIKKQFAQPLSGLRAARLARYGNGDAPLAKKPGKPAEMSGLAGAVYAFERDEFCLHQRRPAF